MVASAGADGKQTYSETDEGKKMVRKTIRSLTIQLALNQYIVITKCDLFSGLNFQTRRLLNA